MIKKRIFAILMVFILAVSVLPGCSKSKGQPVSNETQQETTDDSLDLIDSENAENTENTEKQTKEGVPSPISGIYTDEANVIRRPFAVMLDNQSKARPQAGLDQAEMVFEILAEGWITRYLAVFLINEPESIGPVRSARPYFIDKAMEFNALYVHVGGSPQAFSDIKAFKIADIDAMSRDGSIFWRKKHKSAPHNMYTDTKAIRKAASSSHYDDNIKFETLKFNDDHKKINGLSMLSMEIPYYKDYKVSFKYDEGDNVYYRFINNKPHLDEISKKHLSAVNMIVQKAETKVIDSEGRLEIELVGQGEGLYATNGEMRKIIWKKNNRKSITRYYYEDGTEIQLNPGVTWIQVVPSNQEIITK